MLFLPNIAIIFSVLLAADYGAPGIRKILLSACWKFMQLQMVFTVMSPNSNIKIARSFEFLPTPG